MRLGRSLANTAEPLYLFNRSGNSQYAERAGGFFMNKAVATCIRAGFRKILLRGTRGSPRTRIWILGTSRSCRGTHRIAKTTNLDSWDDAANIRFIFGYAA